mgnify:CR=1 FL=1
MYVSLLKTVVLAGSEFSIQKFYSFTPQTKLRDAPILSLSITTHNLYVCTPTKYVLHKGYYLQHNHPAAMCILVLHTSCLA